MVHSVDCPNAITIGLESERVVAVEWDTEKEKKNSYKVGIEVETQNKPGVLAKVTAVMADENSNITDANLSVKDEQTGIVSITLEVANLAQLQEMMDAVMKVNGVKNVKRVKNKHSSRGYNKSMSEK
jgi:(p)ppGpp synthase/HD superfamily hydrolase